VPFQSLVTLSIATYQPEACPLCQAGLPVTKPGSRTSAI
jgi:orotate phosphoribosyltransferase